MFGRVSMALAIVFGVLAVAFVDSEAGPRVALPFTLDDMNGNKVDLRSFAGKPIVINLWATWCGPCRKETPDLEELSQHYRDRGLQVIGISTDDKPEAIRKFAEEMKVTYPMLVGLGQQELYKAIGFDGEVLPFSVLIKANGAISESFIGIRSKDDWHKKIAALF